MVSMIVPCYNSEAFIDRCIDSILSQTFRDIELIMVNDGSTDQTHERIEARRQEIEAAVTSFLYIREPNQGVGAACSNAFSLATGEFLILLDSDDFMLPESIRMQVDYLKTHPEYALVRTNGYYVSEDNVNVCDSLLEVNEQMKMKEDIFEDLMLGRTYNWPGTYMVRMSVLKQYYPDQKIYPSRSGQNLQFVMMAAYHRAAGFIDVPLMKYIVRHESLSHFSGKDALEKELKAMDGYKDIRIHLISNYIRTEEQHEWLERIDKLYLKIHMQLALKYQNKELMVQSYKALSLLKKTDIDTKILYFSLINPSAAFCLKVVRKIKSCLYRK